MSIAGFFLTVFLSGTVGALLGFSFGQDFRLEFRGSSLKR